jgi:asparagine synthase (glutamine-hydrolysing)
MCGIVGIQSLTGRRPIDLGLLEAMNRTIVHRGPDSDGRYEDPGHVGLAMRRLSIIDVSGGDQPISNEDGSVWTVFNGEIYHFRELRSNLESRGHRFRTATDTEVIVHAYEEFGDDFVQHLDGMFAFALWDSRRKRLILARDRVGIKQLYYSVCNGQLLWGSEIKCILAHPEVPRELRASAVQHFLTYLYVPEPITAFQGIEELPAGHLLISEKGSFSLRKYWELRYEVDPTLTPEAAAQGIRDRLDESVRTSLISDVPLGAFLSGGIDSASMVALMARHSEVPVETFSIGYDNAGANFDERAFAREIAQRYQTHHHELVMQPNLTEIVPELVRAFDQPAADASAIPTWYLAKDTRKHVTVALSGVGGDELAAGYERHRGVMVGERFRWIPSWVTRSLLKPLVSAIPDSPSGHQWVQRVKRFVGSLELPFDDRYFELLVAFSTALQRELLTPEIAEQIDWAAPRDLFRRYLEPLGDTAPLNRALYADLKLFLPSNLLTLTDRMSMAHSLEVRVPFLDHHLLEFAARIPPDLKLRGLERKHILKRAVQDLLPPGFLKRRKMGFSLPLTVWFRNELRPYVEDVLSERAIRECGVFRYPAVRTILDDHFARRANYDGQIWALITFTTWYETYIAGAGGCASAGAHRLSSRIA